MEFHPVANLFPLMSDEEFKNLCSDINANGLLEPIWTHDGMIVDGRNRYKACQAVKVSPVFRKWNGNGSLVTFVVSINLHRRHMSIEQKAIIAVNMKPMLAEEAKERQKKAGGDRKSDEYQKSVTCQGPEAIFDLPKGRASSGESNDLAGKLVGVSGATVKRMDRIMRESPELTEQVKNNKITIRAASDILIGNSKKGERVSESLRPDPKLIGKYHSTAHQFSTMAISQLERIKKDDPQRVAALAEVLDYVNAQLQKGE